jgi:DNA-binding transcriptional LysR family regulator
MNLRQIEMFRAVMQTGSFTAAAEALHISQPGVSRAARHLEIQLGVPLFERVQGRIRPTDEAVALHEEIERSFHGVRSIQQFAEGLKHGTYSMLRVACSANVGARVVPRAIAAMLQARPAAQVSFEVITRTPQMIEALVARQVDLGISSVALEHPVLQARTIGYWELVCLFPRGHALAAKKMVTPHDIAGEPVVTFHGDTLQGRLIPQWLQQEQVPLAARATVRSGQTAASLVASGVGIAFVDHLTAISAEPFGLDWRPIRKSPRTPIQAAWSSDRAPSQQSQRMVKRIQEELAAIAARLGPPGGSRGGHKSRS